MSFTCFVFVYCVTLSCKFNYINTLVLQLFIHVYTLLEVQKLSPRKSTVADEPLTLCFVMVKAVLIILQRVYVVSCAANRTKLPLVCVNICACEQCN